MSDDIERLLQQRSERGTVRGADDVFASARAQIDEASLDEPTGGGGGRTLFLAAAAVIAVALGGAVLLRGVQPTSTDAADDGGNVVEDQQVIEVEDADGETDQDADGGPEEGTDGSGDDAVGGSDDGGAEQVDESETGVDSDPVTGDGSDGAATDGGDDPSTDQNGETGDDVPSEESDGTNPEEDPPPPGSVTVVETISVGEWGPVRSVDAEPVGGGWRIDVEPVPNDGATGGAIVRTAEPVRAVDGRLIVEVDFASAPQGRDSSAFGEVVVTPRAAPVAEDGFYLNETFVGDAAFGCRLQVDRLAVCDLVGPDGTQVWEINFFTEVGVARPAVTGDESWSQCTSSDSDRCLDTFRIELSQTEVRFLVNGVVHLHQTGLPSIPGTFFDQPVHVHLGSTVIRHPGGTETFRWGPLGVG